MVIENDRSDDARRLGDWLTDAGLELDIRRPYDGDSLPERLTDHGGLLVLGGPQSAYDTPVEGTNTAWFGSLGGLLRSCVSQGTPVLGVCLGAQLLAHATGGRVARDPDGYDIGPRLVGKRDVAGDDPLFADVPLVPDALECHQDQITALPPGAVVLAASPRTPYEAFRVGERAWGIQFHFECDLPQFTGWLAHHLDDLPAGVDADDLAAAVDRVLPDMLETWRPMAERFAALVRGEGPARRRMLPLVAD